MPLQLPFTRKTEVTETLTVELGQCVITKLGVAGPAVLSWRLQPGNEDGSLGAGRVFNLDDTASAAKNRAAGTASKVRRAWLDSRVPSNADTTALGIAGLTWEQAGAVLLQFAEEVET